MEINETTKNIPKNTKKRKIWLFVWYLNSPPSVEYIANILTIPKIKIENTRKYKAEVILYDPQKEIREEIGQAIEKKEKRKV